MLRSRFDARRRRDRPWQTRRTFCNSHLAMCLVRALCHCALANKNFAASDKLRDCPRSRKFVNGPASAVVASMLRSGWQNVLGPGFGMHRGVLSFASVGHGELQAVLQDAYDRWTWQRAVTRQTSCTGTGWSPPLVAPIKLTMQHRGTSGEHLARGALQSMFVGTLRTQNLEWAERLSPLSSIYDS